MAALKKKAESSGGALGADVAEMERALASRNAELANLKSELGKKVNETSQFQNVMQMLKKKNAQIEELRRRLKQYEPGEEDD